METCIQKEALKNLQDSLKLNDIKTEDSFINIKLMQKELHEINNTTKSIQDTMDKFIDTTNNRFEKERARNNERYAPMSSYRLLAWFAKLAGSAIILAILWAVLKLVVL